MTNVTFKVMSKHKNDVDLPQVHNVDIKILFFSLLTVARFIHLTSLISYSYDESIRFLRRSENYKNEQIC